MHMRGAELVGWGRGRRRERRRRRRRRRRSKKTNRLGCPPQ
jgi:hypothetical protein